MSCATGIHSTHKDIMLNTHFQGSAKLCNSSYQREVAFAYLTTKVLLNGVHARKVVEMVVNVDSIR
jgi:hypothetical protein